MPAPDPLTVAPGAGEPTTGAFPPVRGPAGGEPPAGTGRGRRLARNTAIFSVATGLSRLAGLAREVVASSYFGTQGRFSAFTIAFQIPNLMRSLVADSALSAAFVPVFTELLEQRRRRDALQLAGTLFLLILLGLGALTGLFIVVAPLVVPLFLGSSFDGPLTQLTVGLSQVLFPIVVLLALNGLTVGILNAYDHFSIPAIAPLVWNAVIIAALVGLRPQFAGPDQLYAYAIGVLVGTVAQLAIALPVLGRIGFELKLAFNWRDERVRRVFTLMLPVTIGLGIINFDVFLNDTLGSLVSQHAPRAIDAAFRIYMLPQGMFSVALATVLFPALSRASTRGDLDDLRSTMANGLRQILLMLVPAAAATVALSTPIVRLIYQHGSFDAHSTDEVALALFWFSFSLPFAGVNLLLTRTFFSLQRPWLPTGLAAGSLVLNALVSIALYKPFGIAGPVIGTAVASLAMAISQGWALRRRLGGIDGAQTLSALLAMLVGAEALIAASALSWRVLDAVLGRSLPGQIASVSVALLVGALAYGAVLFALSVEEVHQIRRLLAGRLRRSRPPA